MERGHPPDLASIPHPQFFASIIPKFGVSRYVKSSKEKIRES
jgi:hypothetical protein